MGFPAQQMVEDIVGQIILSGRSQQRIGEQFVDMLVSQVMEKTVNVVRLVPQERISKNNALAPWKRSWGNHRSRNMLLK